MKWSIPVIVVALSACILFGSVGFQDTVRETTEYTPVLTDLAPIVDADPVTESVNYNPLTNVTGWGPNVAYVTQTTASLYKYVTDSTWQTNTSAQIQTKGIWVQQPNIVNNLFQWRTSDGQTINESTDTTNLLGGWHGVVENWIGNEGHEIIDAYYEVGADPHTPINWDYILVRSLNTWGLPNNCIITASSTSVHGGIYQMLEGPRDWSYNLDHYDDGNVVEFDEYLRYYLGEYGVISGDYYYRDGLFYKISGYDTGGNPQVQWGTAYNLSILTDLFTYTFDYREQTSSTTYYIKPYTLATLRTGASSWENGYGNTSVVFIADAQDLNFSINGGAAPASPLSSSQPDMAAWISGYTGKIQITINSDGTSYWQGVTTYSNTKEYTVSDYRYELTASGNVTTSPIRTITLYYLNGSTGTAAIVDTWVPQDSNGLLWQDGRFPINTVFSSLWASENLRAQFNSFVTTGTGLTINGVTYPVSDGKITIDQKTFSLTGSSIEWTNADASTTLIAPNGDTYDLGTRSGAVAFTLDGVWYGSVSLDTFEVKNVSAKEAVYGMVPDISWIAWVFVGVVVMGTVALLATGRQLDIMDLVALGMMAIIGIIAAVMI